MSSMFIKDQHNVEEECSWNLDNFENIGILNSKPLILNLCCYFVIEKNKGRNCYDLFLKTCFVLWIKPLCSTILLSKTKKKPYILVTIEDVKQYF